MYETDKGYTMTLKKVDLETTSLTLEELLSDLGTNTEILLTRGAKPIARISLAEKAYIAPAQRILGLHEGQGWISDDFNDELF